MLLNLFKWLTKEIQLGFFLLFATFSCFGEEHTLKANQPDTSQSGKLIWKSAILPGEARCMKWFSKDPGTIYLGTGNFLYAINIKDGKLKWKYQMDDALDNYPAMIKIGSEQHIYFYSKRGTLYALKADSGKKIKEIHLGTIQFLGASGENKMVFLTDGMYLCVYDSDLNFKWKHMIGGFCKILSCIDNVFYVGGPLDFYAIDLNNNELWKHRTFDIVNSSPEKVDNSIYFSTECGWIYGLNADDGKELWSYNSRAKKESGFAIITNEGIYFGTDNGYFRCLDLNGKVRWEVSAKGDAFLRFPNISVIQNRAVFATQNTIFITDLKGNIINKAFDGDPGLNFGFGPSIRGNKILYSTVNSSTSSSYAIDLNGNEQWKQTLQQGKTSGDVVEDSINNTVIFSDSTYLYNVSL